MRPPYERLPPYCDGGNGTVVSLGMARSDADREVALN